MTVQISIKGFKYAIFSSACSKCSKSQTCIYPGTICQLSMSAKAQAINRAMPNQWAPISASMFQ